MSSRSWGRLWLSAGGALGCAVAGIKTAVVLVSMDVGTQCMRSLSIYFWISTTWLLLVALATALVDERHAAVRLALRKRRWFKRLHFFGALSVTSLLWGVTGIVWTMQPTCEKLQDPDRWLLSGAMGVAIFFLCGSLYCLLRAVLISVQDLPAGQETIPALVCIRCSCCSIAVKRILIIGPIAFLAVVNGIAWARSSQSPASTCSSVCSTYFSVATLLLLLLVATKLCGLYADVTIINKNTTKKDEASEHNEKSARRRQRRSRVLWGSLLVQVAVLGWGIHGLKWGFRVESQTPVAEVWTVSKCTEALVHSVISSAIQLLVAGCILLTTTICCRLEDLFIPPSTCSRTSGPRPLIESGSSGKDTTETHPMFLV